MYRYIFSQYYVIKYTILGFTDLKYNKSIIIHYLTIGSKIFCNAQDPIFILIVLLKFCENIIYICLLFWLLSLNKGLILLCMKILITIKYHHLSVYNFWLNSLRIVFSNAIIYNVHHPAIIIILSIACIPIFFIIIILLLQIICTT